MAKETIDSLVEGGNANPGPPLGPALGPLGVNAAEVVKAINERTKDFAGMKVPVRVIVDVGTKEFEIVVGSPPTSALIKKELGIEKGSGDGKPVGDLNFQQVMKIANMKKDSLLALNIKSAIKEVVGACQSVMVNIEGRKPKEIIAEIDRGLLDDVIAGRTTEMPELVLKEEEVKIIGEEPVAEAEAVEKEEGAVEKEEPGTEKGAPKEKGDKEKAGREKQDRGK